MTSDDSDFVDEIVADRRPVHTAPPSDDFKPWHRVRKEFIRQQQWNELTIRLAKRRWFQELRQDDIEWALDDDAKEVESSVTPASEMQKRPLRCLVIPGDDLLDIRALWRDTQEHNCQICYLGFNERHGSDQEGTRIHVANNAVTSLSRVNKNSQVIGDRFEHIIHQNSQARRYLRSYGPYHVVNLDFCGSIFPNTQSDAQPYLKAVHEMLIYQFAEQKSPWLLFVTTEVQPSIADPGKLESFCRLARNNYNEHAEFRDEVGKFLPESAFENAEVSVNLGGLTEDQMVKLFGVALGKWLLQLSHSAQPQWTVSMRRSYQYSINEDKGAVMLALAFEFLPNITPPVDRSGISSLNIKPKEFPDEKECALKIARSVAAIQDVDIRLDAEPELKQKLTDDHASLLESAGFDRDAYVAWVAAGETL